MFAGIRRRNECGMCGELTTACGKYCASCQGSINDVSREKRKIDIDQYVYAISVRGASDALVKFGYTRSIKLRLNTLQTGSPVALELLASCQGLRHHERSIHLHLARDREHGEWFRRTERSMAVVEAIFKNEILQFLAEHGPRGRTIKHLQRQ